MEEKRWESCNAEALLEEFFSQDDLRQLALSTGELLGCPLLVLDDTFHVAAHHLPLGFSDVLFETAVRRGPELEERATRAHLATAHAHIRQPSIRYRNVLASLSVRQLEISSFCITKFTYSMPSML